MSVCSCSSATTLKSQNESLTRFVQQSPYKVYYEGNRFLLSVPSKFPPLRIGEMVWGVEPVLLDDLGLNFETEAGAENPVLWARVVAGYRTLIEGVCQSPIAGTPVFKAGKRVAALTRSGFTNIRDQGPGIALPWRHPFLSSLAAYPDLGRDNPAASPLGRYLQDIPGWIGDLRLGMPMLRRTLAALPIPL